MRRRLKRNCSSPFYFFPTFTTTRRARSLRDVRFELCARFDHRRRELIVNILFFVRPRAKIFAFLPFDIARRVRCVSFDIFALKIAVSSE